MNNFYYNLCKYFKLLIRMINFKQDNVTTYLLEKQSTKCIPCNTDTL